MLKCPREFAVIQHDSVSWFYSGAKSSLTQNRWRMMSWWHDLLSRPVMFTRQARITAHMIRYLTVSVDFSMHSFLPGEKLWTHQQSSLELCSFFLFSLECLTGRRMSLFLFTFPTSLVFFPSQLYKVKPTFTIQVIVHTASKNNISAARQSSLWCNRSPEARMAHNDSLCNVQTDSHYFSCSLSLSLSWLLSFHTPWIFLRITPWFIWKCGFSGLISGVC